jgi:thiamine pyrophosphokinase
MVKIQGSYQISNNQLQKDGIIFLIKERKVVTPKKPKLYLSSIKPTFEYVSSMYPISENTYQIDYKGAKYKLILEPLKEVANVIGF